MSSALTRKSLTSSSAYIPDFSMSEITMTGILESSTHPVNQDERTSAILKDLESDEMKALMNERTNQNNNIHEVEPLLMQVPKHNQGKTPSALAAAKSPPVTTNRAKPASVGNQKVNETSTSKAAKEPQAAGGSARPAKARKQATEPPAKVKKRLLPTDDLKMRALRSALSAFMHLHQPTMTAAEQSAFLAKYQGREGDMWRELAKRFGERAVPSRFLQSAEEARGSIRIQLIPKNSEENKKLAKRMKEYGIEPITKETVTRTTTIKDLISSLRLRWEPLDDRFSTEGCDLNLFSVGTVSPLSPSLIVRDCVMDGCLEYGWWPSDGAKLSPLNEDSWGHEHSLAALPQSSSAVSKTPMDSFSSEVSSEAKVDKKLRRIQPISVTNEAKRVRAEDVARD